MHPQSKHWHLIDYFLVHKPDLKDVIHTKVMPSAECQTDYLLVPCKLRLHFKPKPRKGVPPKKKFNFEKLQSAEVKADFQAGLQSKLKTATAQKTLLLKHSKINWGVLSCRNLKRFLGLPPRRTKTGSTRTTKRFRNCYQRRNNPTKPTWLSCHVLWGEQPSISFAASFSISFMRSKMRGGPISQRELSNTQS